MIIDSWTALSAPSANLNLAQTLGSEAFSAVAKVAQGRSFIARKSRPHTLTLLIMKNISRSFCCLRSHLFARLWPKPRAPNIVVILADDLGYGDVGFNGCLDIPTPNIDSIAANGVLCTNGYVTEPYCSPSRAALLTGRYQQRYGQDAGPSPGSTNPRLGLPMTETILPQLLKPAGYVCGAIGKWHLGYVPELYPTRRGFDEFFGFLDAGSHYYHAEVLRNETPIIEPDHT